MSKNVRETMGSARANRWKTAIELKLRTDWGIEGPNTRQNLVLFVEGPPNRTKEISKEFPTSDHMDKHGFFREEII